MKRPDPFAAGRARLHEARTRAGYTLAEAAELTGLDMQSIHRYERRRNTPSAVDLARLCKAYGVSADYVLGLRTEAEEAAFDLLQRAALALAGERAS